MPDYKTGRAAVLAIVLFAVVLALVALWGRPRISLRTQSPPGPAAVAVLPFRNLTGDPELEIVASEIAPAVHEALATSGRFSLVPSEMTFGEVASREGIEEAARKLGADYVVSGSVDAEAGGILVDAYLFRAGGEPGLWVERLRWSEEEKAAIAPELAARIGEGLKR